MEHFDSRVERFEQEQVPVMPSRRVTPLSGSQPQAKAKFKAAPTSALTRECRGTNHRAPRVRDAGGMGPSNALCERPGDDACHADTHPSHGRCSSPSDAPSGGSKCTIEPEHLTDPAQVSADCEESVFTVQNLEMQGLKKMIIQISQELQEVCNTTKLMGKKWVLGEVVCSDQSPWTHQVLQAEGSAFRFGLQQGDHSTR